MFNQNMSESQVLAQELETKKEEYWKLDAKEKAARELEERDAKAKKRIAELPGAYDKYKADLRSGKYNIYDNEVWKEMENPELDFENVNFTTDEHKATFLHNQLANELKEERTAMITKAEILKKARELKQQQAEKQEIEEFTAKATGKDVGDLSERIEAARPK